MARLSIQKQPGCRPHSTAKTYYDLGLPVVLGTLVSEKEGARWRTTPLILTGYKQPKVKPGYLKVVIGKQSMY